MTSHPLSRIVRRDSVPDNGLEFEIVASPDEREALARLFDVRAVESLTGRFLITPWRGRGLKVKGQVDASVEQICVVTLDPVENTVSEDIEVYFAPEGTPMPAHHADSPETHERDIEELVGERIDVGALAAEYVALGLDPYPRKPGVVFAQGEFGEPEEKKGAFAALSVLKGGQDGD